jgi:adenylate cyclase
MLLEGKFFVDKNETAKWAWGMLIVGVTLISIVMFFGHAIVDLITVILITGGFYYIDTYYLTPLGHDNKLFFVLFAIISTYSWNTFINFYLASKEKKQIRGTFSRYVAPAIVNQMLENPDKLKVGGEKKNITVFFSDVRDFTTISESLTPTQLSTCLNKYMGIMTDLLFDYEGTLDKYIGDAIVAYWGAPLEVENHALKAVNASLQMIEVLPKINEEFKRLGFPEFRHGIGLNTGDCSVGNMGSDKIFSYTALGDSMNLGARLESLCKYYGVQLNISEFTLAAIPEQEREKFTYRILDKVRVKGKSEPVTMYEVYHSFHHLMTDKESHENYLLGFEYYQQQKFQEAIDLLKPICDKYEQEKISRHIIERCMTYLQSPPPADWDGVFTHTTKG